MGENLIGIDLLAADLGTTPERLALYVAALGLGALVAVVGACWKLSQAPDPEGVPQKAAGFPSKRVG